MHKLARVAFIVLSTFALSAVPAATHAQASKPGFQATVTKNMQAILIAVRDVSEKQKVASLESSLSKLDATTLKALDQQVTYEWQQYMLKPESRTPNGVRIITHFKQAQTLIRGLMAKKK